MWQLRDKPRTVKVTRALAKEFAEMDPAPHDRPLSERRLLVYQRLLKEGTFRPVTWARAHCAETGGVYRVNGKHTSVMLSGLTEMPEFYVVVETYDCESLEDVARLYATFDSKLMARTIGDINASFAATVPQLREVASRNINICVAGINFHLAGGVNASRTTPAAERAEVLLEYPDFIVWVDKLLAAEKHEEGRRSSRHLARMSVTGAMLGTWQKSKQQATEFWVAVRDETGANNSTPDRKLSRYLLTTSTGRGKGTQNVRHADDREIYVKCIHGWNAWRKQEPTNLQYYAEAPVPSFR